MSEKNLLLDLYTKIQSVEDSAFSIDGSFNWRVIPTLRRLYTEYEELRAKVSTDNDRYSFIVQTTTYNAPDDLNNLLNSVKTELEMYSYPGSLIHVVILDDSDNEQSCLKNRSLCEYYRSFFSVHFFGSREQKVLISRYVEEFPEVLRIFNKNMVDFSSPSEHVWGHKGVAGAMNMAFLASRHVAKSLNSDNVRVVGVDEDVTFNVYLQCMKGEALFSQGHAYSYFHRLEYIIGRYPDVDLLLGASVGDYCTPVLTWKVVSNFAKIMASKFLTPDTKEKVARAFVENFPTYDLEFNNDYYVPRKGSYFVGTDGMIGGGQLGLSGVNTSGNHMILSPRLLREMNFCYFGPGRVADARFFLLVQNDERFKTGCSSQLCLSHTKRAHDSDHELTDELHRHIYDEYSYIGYNFALFFLMYTTQGARFSPHLHTDKERFSTEVVTLVSDKFPDAVPHQLENIQKYTFAVETLKDMTGGAADYSMIIATLEKSQSLLLDLYDKRKEIAISAGIPLFVEAIDIFKIWEDQLRKNG